MTAPPGHRTTTQAHAHAHVHGTNVPCTCIVATRQMGPHVASYFWGADSVTTSPPAPAPFPHTHETTVLPTYTTEASTRVIFRPMPSCAWPAITVPSAAPIVIAGKGTSGGDGEPHIDAQRTHTETALQCRAHRPGVPVVTRPSLKGWLGAPGSRLNSAENSSFTPLMICRMCTPRGREEDVSTLSTAGIASSGGGGDEGVSERASERDPFASANTYTHFEAKQQSAKLHSTPPRTPDGP